MRNNFSEPINKNLIINVEDNDGHALLLKRNLQKTGVTNEILRYKDGDGILKYLKSVQAQKNSKINRPIILLDLKLPKVSGIEVLKYMNKKKIIKNTPVIVISTTDNPAEIQNCFKLGCHDYFVKPVDYNRLHHVITNLSKNELN